VRKTECWLPLDLTGILALNKELKECKSTLKHQAAILHARTQQSKDPFQALGQRRMTLCRDSEQTLQRSYKEDLGRARVDKASLDHEKRCYEEQLVLYQQTYHDQELANTVLDRCLRDCERCARLEQSCDFVGDSRSCAVCANVTTLCTGDIDDEDIVLVEAATVSLTEEMDEVSLDNVSDSFDARSCLRQSQTADRKIRSHRLGSAISQPALVQAYQEFWDARQFFDKDRIGHLQQDAKYIELWLLRRILETCYLDLVAWRTDHGSKIDKCHVRSGAGSDRS